MSCPTDGQFGDNTQVNDIAVKSTDHLVLHALYCKISISVSILINSDIEDTLFRLGIHSNKLSSLSLHFEVHLALYPGQRKSGLVSTVHTCVKFPL